MKPGLAGGHSQVFFVSKSVFRNLDKVNSHQETVFRWARWLVACSGFGFTFRANGSASDIILHKKSMFVGTDCVMLQIT
jgi:hypothetical protein